MRKNKYNKRLINRITPTEIRRMARLDKEAERSHFVYPTIPCQWQI